MRVPRTWSWRAPGLKKELDENVLHFCRFGIAYLVAFGDVIRISNPKSEGRFVGEVGRFVPETNNIKPEKYPSPRNPIRGF